MLRAVLSSAYRSIQRITKGTGFRLCDLKIFTDNIVIGYPIRDIEWTAGESELGHIFGIFIEYQVCYLWHFAIPQDRYEATIYAYDRVTGKLWQSLPDK